MFWFDSHVGTVRCGVAALFCVLNLSCWFWFRLVLKLNRNMIQLTLLNSDIGQPLYSDKNAKNRTIITTKTSLYTLKEPFT